MYQKIMDIYRDEIASCIECSFKKVSQKDAAQLLLFNNVNEIIPFAKKVPNIGFALTLCIFSIFNYFAFCIFLLVTKTRIKRLK